MSFPWEFYIIKTEEIINERKKITHHDSLQRITLHKPMPLMGRMSLFAADAGKGSFTVETAVVLPLFLFFILTVFVFFDVQKEQNQLHTDFSNAAKHAALLACATDEKELICLQSIHQVSSQITFFGKKNIFGYVKVSARPWTGSDGREFLGNTGSAETMVYRTVNGSVYHTNPDCSYLNPSIEAIHKRLITAKRNENGEIYRPCETCGSHVGETVYITDHGNRYHGDISCSSLKRNILVFSKEEVGNYPHCAKCAAWEAIK